MVALGIHAYQERQWDILTSIILHMVDKQLTWTNISNAKLYFYLKIKILLVEYSSSTFLKA